jgi:hypothetical protein
LQLILIFFDLNELGLESFALSFAFTLTVLALSASPLLAVSCFVLSLTSTA